MVNNDGQFSHSYVGGFETIACTRQELAGLMLKDCLQARIEGDSWRPKLVYSSNGQGISLAGRSTKFMEVMSQADIIHADGMPAVFASKQTESPLPERISTTDFFHDAARVAEAEGLRFFMLGATEAQNREAVEAIEAAYPHLNIVGRHHGYFDASEDEAICQKIRASEADVLWVALGKPRQEEWCLNNRERLSGVGWLKTCGGLYAFLAGDVKRAPVWMQRLGFEWLFRMCEDPRRLGWRYLTTNPYAMWRILTKTNWRLSMNRRKKVQ